MRTRSVRRARGARTSAARAAHTTPAPARTERAYADRPCPRPRFDERGAQASSTRCTRGRQLSPPRDLPSVALDAHDDPQQILVEGRLVAFPDVAVGARGHEGTSVTLALGDHAVTEQVLRRATHGDVADSATSAAAHERICSTSPGRTIGYMQVP